MIKIHFFICLNRTPDGKDIKFESFQISDEFLVRPCRPSPTDLSDNVCQLSRDSNNLV
jgi:hypothetical protein